MNWLNLALKLLVLSLGEIELAVELTENQYDTLIIRPRKKVK